MAVTTLVPSKTAFRIPSLDGMRTIAVLMVVIGHGLTVPAIFPGHAGVTIFFFLSGYLIVSLLRREYQKTSTVSLVKFYLRRTIRILPPAYLAVGCAMVLAATGILSANVTWSGVLAEVLNYTNYYIVVAGRDGLPPETTQLWSLAVEEHYYLVIPALLLFLFRRKLNSRKAGLVLLAFALVVPVWRIALGVFFDAGFDRLYTSTDTRIDCMLIGSAMALVWNPVMGDKMPGILSGRRLSFVALTATLVFIASSVVPSMAFRLSIADTIQCLSLIAVFAYIVSAPESLTGRVLNSRVATRIGILSFSIYLFHKMVYALVKQVTGVPIVVDLLTILISILVAEVVYRIIEKPLGRLRKRLHA